METTHDVLIIGAGAAGSAAALQFGRIRRTVALVDAGAPRNLPAAHMHGYLGHDGNSPTDFLSNAHEELRQYGISPVPARVASLAENDDGTFRASISTGATITARRVLLATGVTDELPDIAGVQEHWGGTVLHCPWCHGYEVRDQRIVVLDTTGLGSHQAELLAQLSDHVVLVNHCGLDRNRAQRDRLDRAGIAVVNQKAVAVEMGVTDPGVRLGDGTLLGCDAVAVAPTFRANLGVAANVGLNAREHASGLGTHLEVDQFGKTANPRIYAAGNVAEPMQQVLHAAAHGSSVAMAITADLLNEDLMHEPDRTADGTEWDERYESFGQMWSGEPNGSLVVELENARPGSILDVGCGEGADAVWLAKHGWQVTAVDVSLVAVDRGRSAAAERNLTIDFQARDIIAQPLTTESFDVVAICYPALRQPQGLEALRTLLDAVEPGGELLVVGHALEDFGTAREHGFDPADYVLIDDMIAELEGRFEITTDEIRERPNPPADAHHVRDRVLRARRIGTSG